MMIIENLPLSEIFIKEELKSLKVKILSKFEKDAISS